MMSRCRVLVATALLLTACTSTTNGTGRTTAASTTTPTTPTGAPSTTSTTSPPSTSSGQSTFPPSGLGRTPVQTAIGDPGTADLCRA
ncbi:MAG TPA: hypothetical protein VGH57_37440, partial [Amycolatopsis sp.]